MKYRGIIRIEGNDVTMESGGIKVRLEADPQDFLVFNGVSTTISGEQQADTIKNAVPLSQPEAAADSTTEGAQLESVLETIKAHGNELRAFPAVLGIRPGFRVSGELHEPAIIAVIKPGMSIDNLPAHLGDIPVETQIATPLEMIEGVLPLSVWEGVLPEAIPQIGYTPPEPPLALAEKKVRNITCHVGPDSGWETLKSFIEGTTKSLTVAMYEFYANHIIDAVTQLGEETDATLNMILQVSSNDETIEKKLRDSWENRLAFTKASVSGPRRVFNNSYHTKVAVRDSNSFWLSSGNWSPSSQPVIPPGFEQVLYSKGNREWHVVVEDQPLAEMFEKFIEHDISQAQAAVEEPEAIPVLPDLLIPETLLQPEAVVVQDHPFKSRTFAVSGNPVKVKPLMSPDNYASEVLKLINNAKKKLYLQFSYIRQPSREKFDDIITAIGEKMKQGLDVRVLVGPNQESQHSDLLIATRGWKRSMFRRQRSKVHNKGILIDGKIAVVGSNNWSSDGTQYNRDASLVFYSRPIAQYYTEVFLFDWDNLSKPIGTPPEVTPIIAPESGTTPLGMVRIPWNAWFDE